MYEFIYYIQIISNKLYNDNIKEYHGSTNNEIPKKKTATLNKMN